MLTTRPATHDDIPRLHPIIERAYRGETARASWTHEADLVEGQRIDPTMLIATVRDPSECLLIAEQEGVPIGCVQISDRGHGLAYLGLLCVDPTLQAGGIGKQILAVGEDTARARFGSSRMEMTVIESRTNLIAFYERRGYTLSGERRNFPIPLDPPLFMTVLVKPLDRVGTPRATNGRTMVGARDEL